MIILATTLFIVFLLFVFVLEDRKTFYNDLGRSLRVFMMTSKPRFVMHKSSEE